jgi:hypothetical protein
MNFTPVAAVGLSAGSFAPSTDFTGGALPYQYGGGLLIGFKMYPAFFTELGLLYLPRGFSQTFNDGTTYNISFTTVQIPILIRYYPAPAFSIGAGAYFSHGLGAISGTSSVDPSVVNTQEYGASYGADDYGAVVSASLSINVFSSLGIVVDGRYLTSLVNVSKMGGITTYLNDFQILAGIRIGKK